MLSPHRGLDGLWSGAANLNIHSDLVRGPLKVVREHLGDRSDPMTSAMPLRWRRPQC
jgi:hypothetical protein